VLDASALQDDFYLNLVYWSSHNVLAVGLGKCVTKLYDLGNDDSVCRLGGHNGGTSLAVGTSKGKVQIWDAAYCKRVRTMEGHGLRVGALAWSSSMLSSGSQDKNILQRDPRAQEAFVSKLNGHKSEHQSQMSTSNNMQLLTHSVLSVVMDVVSEGPSQTYVSYHMQFQQHNLNSMRNDQSRRSASNGIYDVRSAVSEHGLTGPTYGQSNQEVHQYLTVKPSILFSSYAPTVPSPLQTSRSFVTMLSFEG
ncbi:FIZZY-related 2-like protein, partial [Tanacetum coccineum]